MAFFGISPQASLRHKILANSFDAGCLASFAVPTIGPALYGDLFSPTVTIASVAVGLGCIAGKLGCQIKSESPVADKAAVITALKVLHTLTLAQKKSTNSGADELRLSVYAKLPKQDMLFRITPKIGDSAQSSEPVSIPTPIGVVGMVYRTGLPWLANLAPKQNLVEFLVSDWSFPAELAAQVRQDRRSWYGVPLKGTGTTCFGVLFCDSCDHLFFGDPSSKDDTPRRKMLRLSAVPIAEALKSAYHSVT